MNERSRPGPAESQKYRAGGGQGRIGDKQPRQRRTGGTPEDERVVLTRRLTPARCSRPQVPPQTGHPQRCPLDRAVGPRAGQMKLEFSSSAVST